MYCVIQKVFNKKCNSPGESKKIEVTEYNWGIGDNKPNIYYGYKCTGHFVRTHKEAFKISIHKSYRKNGEIKKKQWVLCTMGYYDLLDWSLYDCAGGKIDRVSEETGISADDIYDIVYKKLDPIISKITEEYEQTEEYKIKVKNNKILSKYFTAKGKFEEKYGQDNYDYCYDVFGMLRNEEYLNQLHKEYKTKQEYYSSYYENFKSNYKSNNDSSYSDIGHSTYTKDEKVKLKKIYKVLALKFHPDINNGDADMMKFINRLKEQWGI